jgi:hypothetical protein
MTVLYSLDTRGYVYQLMQYRVLELRTVSSSVPKLDWCKWSAARSGLFIPGENTGYRSVTRLGRPHLLSGDKSQLVPGFKPYFTGRRAHSPVSIATEFFQAHVADTNKIETKHESAQNNSINPLNAELNPICHLLVLLGDSTFMGPCIVSIFQYTCLFISGNCSTCFGWYFHSS